MKKILRKTQQKIYTIFQTLKSYASKLCISSFVGGQFKKRQKRSKVNQYSLSELRRTTQTDQELLNKVQNVLTEFFNGKITIKKEVRYELINFIEEYHRKHDNVSMTIKALTIEDKSIQNKN